MKDGFEKSDGVVRGELHYKKQKDLELIVIPGYLSPCFDSYPIHGVVPYQVFVHKYRMAEIK